MNFLKDFLKKYKVLILLLLLFIIFIVINSDKIEGFVNKPEVNLRAATVTFAVGDVVQVGSTVTATTTTTGGVDIDFDYNITDNDFSSILNRGPPDNNMIPSLNEDGTRVFYYVDDPDILLIEDEGSPFSDSVIPGGYRDGIERKLLLEDTILIQNAFPLDVISQFDNNYTTKSIMKWYVDANFDNIIRVIPENSMFKDYSGYGYRIIDGVAIECGSGTYMPKNKRLLTNRAGTGAGDNDWSTCIDSEPLSNDIPLSYDSSITPQQDSKNAFSILDIISHTLNLIPQKNSTQYFDIDASLIQDNEMIHSYLEGQIAPTARAIFDGREEQVPGDFRKDFPELKMKIVEDNIDEYFADKLSLPMDYPQPVDEYMNDSYDDWILNNLTYTKGFLNRTLINDNYTSEGYDFISLPESFRRYYYGLPAEAGSQPRWTTNIPEEVAGGTVTIQDVTNAIAEDNWADSISGWNSDREDAAKGHETRPGILPSVPISDMDYLLGSGNNIKTLYTPPDSRSVSSVNVNGTDGNIRFRPDLDLSDHNKSTEILKNVFRNKRHPRYEGENYEGIDSDGQTLPLITSYPGPSTTNAEAENKDHAKNTIVLLGNIAGMPSSTDPRVSDDSIFEGNSYMIDKFTNLMYLKGDKLGRSSPTNSEKIKTHNISDYEKINGTNVNVKTYNYLMTALYAFARPPVTLGSKYENLTDLTFGGWGTPPSVENEPTPGGRTPESPQDHMRSNIKLLIPSDILGWHTNINIEAKYLDRVEMNKKESEDIIYNMIGLKNIPNNSLNSDTTIEDELWYKPSVGKSVRGAAPQRHTDDSHVNYVIDDSEPLFHINNLNKIHEPVIETGVGDSSSSATRARFNLSDNEITFNYRNIPEFKPNYYLLGNDIGVISTYYELGTHITFRENPTNDELLLNPENLIKHDGSSYRLLPASGDYRTSDSIIPSSDYQSFPRLSTGFAKLPQEEGNGLFLNLSNKNIFRDIFMKERSSTSISSGLTDLESSLTNGIINPYLRTPTIFGEGAPLNEFQNGKWVNYINIAKNGVFSSSFSSANTFQYRLFLDTYDSGSTGDTVDELGYSEIFPNKWQGGSNVPVITKKKREWYAAPEDVGGPDGWGGRTARVHQDQLSNDDYVGRDINPFFYDLPSHYKYEKIDDLEFKNNIINSVAEFRANPLFTDKKNLFYSLYLNDLIKDRPEWGEQGMSFFGVLGGKNLNEVGIGRRDETILVSSIIKDSETSTKLRQIIGSEDLELDRKNKILIGSCRNVFNPSFHSPFGITNPRPITNDYIRTIKIKDRLTTGTQTYDEVSFTLSEIPILRNLRNEGTEVNGETNAIDKQSIPARLTELEVESDIGRDEGGTFTYGEPEWKSKYENFRLAAENSINKILDAKVNYGAILEGERGPLEQEIMAGIPEYPFSPETLNSWKERFPLKIGSDGNYIKHTIVLSIWDRFTEFLQINTYPKYSYSTVQEAEDDLDINQAKKDNISAEGKMFHLATSKFGSDEKKEDLKTTNSLNSIQEPVSIGDTLPRIARLPTEKTFGFGRPDTTIFNSNYNDNHRCLLDSIDQINYSPTWSTGKTAYLILTNFLYNYIYINERNIPVFDERSIQPITLKTPKDFLTSSNRDSEDFNEIVNNISEWGSNSISWSTRKLVDNDLFRFSHQPAEYWNSLGSPDLEFFHSSPNADYLTINDLFYRKTTDSASDIGGRLWATDIFRPTFSPENDLADSLGWVSLSGAEMQTNFNGSSPSSGYSAIYLAGIEKLTKNKGIYEVINFFKSLNKHYTGSDPVTGLSGNSISDGGLSSRLEDVENFIYEKYLEKIFRKIFLYLNQSTEEETPIPTPGLNSDINGSDKNDGLYTTPFKPREDESFRKNDEDYPLHSIISKTLTLQNKHISKFAEDSWKEIMEEGFEAKEFPLSKDENGNPRIIDEDEIIGYYGFEPISGSDPRKFKMSDNSISIGYDINNTDSWSDLNGIGRPRNIWRKVNTLNIYREMAGNPTGTPPEDWPHTAINSLEAVNNISTETSSTPDATGLARMETIEKSEIIKTNLNKTILNVSEIYRDFREIDTFKDYAVITSQGIGGEAWLPEDERFYNYKGIAEGSEDTMDFNRGDGSNSKIKKHISNIDRINWYKLYNTIRSRDNLPDATAAAARKNVGVHPFRQLPSMPNNGDWQDIWLNSPIIDNTLKSTIMEVGDSVTTATNLNNSLNGGFSESLSRLNKSVLHNAKYNPHISELVGITNTYNGRPAFHDFVLKAGINSWGGMVDGVGGIKTHYVSIDKSTEPGVDENTSFNEYYERPIRISEDDNSGGVDLRGNDEMDGYTAQSQPRGAQGDQPAGTGLPFEHIFKTEPFKVDDVIYHRLVLPMPPQIIESDSDDPYGIGINSQSSTGQDETSSVEVITGSSPRPPNLNQRHYYNVMFWKNIYDIIHPKNLLGRGKWFNLGCEYQPGCAEHDTELQCIQINQDGSIYEGGTGLNPVNNKYYYQCVRPYLWDPENNLDSQWDGGD